MQLSLSAQLSSENKQIMLIILTCILLLANHVKSFGHSFNAELMLIQNHLIFIMLISDSRCICCIILTFNLQNV